MRLPATANVPSACFCGAIHRQGNGAGFGERVVVGNEIDVPIGHGAILLDLIEDANSKGMSLLTVGGKETRSW